MTRRKSIKSAALATVVPPKWPGGDVPVVKPVRRGKGKWLMFPRHVKISRATIAAAIRENRDMPTQQNHFSS